MKHLSLIATFVVFIFFSTQAQDKHFSQFYSAPMTMNPALTGAFQGSFRVGAIYRDQWRGALENPFQTYAASFDMRFKIGEKRHFDDAIAGGLLFFADQVGSVNFNTTQMAFSFAYHKALDRSSTQYLSAGLKLGLSKRSLNYERLSFEDQFNGIDDYTSPSGESLPENTLSYGDLATGLYYTVSPKKNQSYYAGFAVHHFNSPNISFYKHEEKINKGKFRLPVKYLLHLGARLPLTEDSDIFPKASASLQGKHLQINVGANIRVVSSSFSSGTALHFGIWARPVKNDTQFGVDAITGLAGIEYRSILLGISYDSNINSITNYSRADGAFEISLTYLGNYENETILCPTF